MGGARSYAAWRATARALPKILNRFLVFFTDTQWADQRRDVSAKIVEQYPDRVPVIVERDPKARIADIDKKKFLAPADISVAKFISEIRKHIKLGRQESLFVFVANNVMPQPNATMAQIYAQYKDGDGFLYIMYSSESSFGGQ
jgi:GABA(A) receptor-associated protein